MDYTDHPCDVADPWYTDDFKTTRRDVLAGCRGLLDLLQVLRYGQLFGGSDYDELNNLYLKRKRTLPSGNLYEAHKEYFGLDDNSRVARDNFNKHQHFVVMTNGLDQKAASLPTRPWDRLWQA